MKGYRESTHAWLGVAPSALVLVAGVFADNVMAASIAASGVAHVFAVFCGFAVGSLAVLTFLRRPLAYPAAAALFSALSAVALTLALPRAQQIVLLSLCALTVVACAVAPRFTPPVQASLPVPVRVKPRDDRQ